MTPAEAYKAAIAKPKKGRWQQSPAAERTVDGIVFDSKIEAAHWCELRLLERAGIIFDLKRQQSYQIEIAGVVLCTFTPDFEYRTDTGALVYEEVKSTGTAKDTAYRLRKRAFELYYRTKVTEVIR